MLKTVLAVAFVLVLGLLAVFYIDHVDTPTSANARALDALIARNIAARGGADSWRAVSSLRLAGQMDLGQGMHVPYVMEQKRPGKMCIEFVFDAETAIQCVAGKTGWKLLPFRGRRNPEPMTEAELREMADTADLYGLLFDAAERGHKVELLGHEPVEGHDAMKLKVTLPGGAVRWVYIDAESGLEVKLEALRILRGKERRVETLYSDWQAAEGILIPRRQETRTEGDEVSHFLTVESVRVNPPLDDSRFVLPVTAGAIHGSTPGASS